MTRFTNSARRMKTHRAIDVARLGTSRNGGTRFGASLIEVIVCTSLVGAILVLAGVTFQLLLRGDKTVSQSFVTERTIARLSVTFRDDVHRAASGKINDDPAAQQDELSLGDPGGDQVRYKVTTEGVARVVMKDDAISSREDYRLPDCKVRFAAGTGSDSSLRMVVIDRPGAVLTKDARPVKANQTLTIESHLNRFHDQAAFVVTAKENANRQPQEDLQ